MINYIVYFLHRQVHEWGIWSPTVVLEMWNHKKRGLVQGPCIIREATLPAGLLGVGDVMLSPVRAPSGLHYKVTQ